MKKALIASLAVAGFGVLGVTEASADETHTITKGETLSTILLNKYNSTDRLQEVAQKNGLSNVDLIFEGEQLVLPDENTSVTQTVQPATQVTSQSDVEQPQQSQPQSQAVASTYTGTSSSAKEWIAQKESSGSYTATNGRYIGRYQLDSSYLNGDYSAENQERVADNYVIQRYGSWEGAQAFWMANGWY